MDHGRLPQVLQDPEIIESFLTTTVFPEMSLLLLYNAPDGTNKNTSSLEKHNPFNTRPHTTYTQTQEATHGNTAERQCPECTSPIVLTATLTHNGRLCAENALSELSATAQTCTHAHRLSFLLACSLAHSRTHIRVRGRRKAIRRCHKQNTNRSTGRHCMQVESRQAAANIPVSRTSWYHGRRLGAFLPQYKGQ